MHSPGRPAGVGFALIAQRGRPTGSAHAAGPVARPSSDHRNGRCAVSGQLPPGGRTSSMRVLVENGEYWLNNKGEQAILDVSVRRCAERWPEARIGVLT